MTPCSRRFGPSHIVIYRFWLKAYPPSFLRVYPPCFWRGVLGKSSCWARNAKQSLSVTLTKRFIPYFPKDYGLTKVKRRIDSISHKFIQKLPSHVKIFLDFFGITDNNVLSSFAMCKRSSFTVLRGGDCIYASFFKYFLSRFILRDFPSTWNAVIKKSNLADAVLPFF
jgi:hypothetical protein